MRRYYLLGRDTADGIKQSVKATEYMRSSKDVTANYPMPDLLNARKDPFAEKMRLHREWQAIEQRARVRHEYKIFADEVKEEPIIQLQPEPVILKAERHLHGFEPHLTLWQRIVRFFSRTG